MAAPSGPAATTGTMGGAGVGASGGQVLLPQAGRVAATASVRFVGVHAGTAASATAPK
jgi:hypothetical protein